MNLSTRRPQAKSFALTCHCTESGMRKLCQVHTLRLWITDILVAGSSTNLTHKQQRRKQGPTLKLIVVEKDFCFFPFQIHLSTVLIFQHTGNWNYWSFLVLGMDKKYQFSGCYRWESKNCAEMRDLGDSFVSPYKAERWRPRDMTADETDQLLSRQ